MLCYGLVGNVPNKLCNVWIIFYVNYQHTKITKTAYTSTRFYVKYTIKTLLLQTFQILFVIKYCQKFSLSNWSPFLSSCYVEGIPLTTIVDNKTVSVRQISGAFISLESPVKLEMLSNISCIFISATNKFSVKKFLLRRFFSFLKYSYYSKANLFPLIISVSKSGRRLNLVRMLNVIG